MMSNEREGETRVPLASPVLSCAHFTYKRLLRGLQLKELGQLVSSSVWSQEWQNCSLY